MGQKSSVRERLDVLMVSRGLVESREQAKRLILAGAVEIKDAPLPKPGQLFDTAVDIRLKGKERYVSRGGLKLEAALKNFSLDITGSVCVDVGTSTGGFTDCMLQHGASRVFAVDVGATQIHEKLKHDPRVTLVEHTNARKLSSALFPETPAFAAVDVSFISILRITPALRSVLKPGGSAVLLIKPQFEAGRQAVSRGRGVIRDEAVHKVVLQNVLEELQNQEWKIRGLILSPIAGGSGNREFLCYVSTDDNAGCTNEQLHIAIDDAIQSARAPLE